MATHIGEDCAVVAGLVLVLFVCRPTQNFIPILLMLAIGSLQLEHLHLARSGVQPGTAWQSGLHLDSKRHALLPAVLLRREFSAYTVHLRTKGSNFIITTHRFPRLLCCLRNLSTTLALRNLRKLSTNLRVYEG